MTAEAREIVAELRQMREQMEFQVNGLVQMNGDLLSEQREQQSTLTELALSKEDKVRKLEKQLTAKEKQLADADDKLDRTLALFHKALRSLRKIARTYGLEREQAVEASKRTVDEIRSGLRALHSS
jgi:hypothetical protein